ncbi:15944_t:CDS:2 [Racocetra persica]|uniref:15944_t:CDS:1 n=1 Tax=Racocetra persica TaxID=160502 RepID=A0ACA9KRL4_9GLOM|nr:15944_t:CDS:2 [Racocetra persica]
MLDYYTTSDEFDLCNATSEEKSDSLNDIEGEAIATIIFKRMRNELSLLVTEYKKQLESVYPNDKEWEVIDIMVELLEPMLIATELLSSSFYLTISDICLTFWGFSIILISL